eukprot:4120803-Lingulodinium_polyedra.AAC.1
MERCLCHASMHKAMCTLQFQPCLYAHFSHVYMLLCRLPAMPASKKRSSAKEANLQAKRQKEWETYSKDHTDRFIQERIKNDKDLALQVEKFINSKLWQKTEKSTKPKVPRFCRGRTTMEKIPPSFMVETFTKWHTPMLSDQLLWKLQKQCHKFFPRMFMAITKIDPSFNIK